MSKTIGHGLGRTRAAVLRVLLNTSSGSCVTQVAAQLELHPNSARFHLDALVKSGFATKSPEPAGRQGRPRMIYQPTAAAPNVDHEHLRELVSVLVDHMLTRLPDPLNEIETAGFRWGYDSAESSTGNAIDDLVDHANELGFVASADDTRTCIRFARCPYLVNEDPARHPICAVHLGMMKGFLSAIGSNLEVESLSRDSSGCQATLRSRTL